MRRHINVFVAENFSDVSELDSLFYPSDQALSSLMYQAMILHRQMHIDQERVLRLLSRDKAIDKARHGNS